jgi:hypothetical protein
MAETYLHSIRQPQPAFGELNSVPTYSILIGDKEATTEPIDNPLSSPCGSNSVQRNRSTLSEKASRTDSYNGTSSVMHLNERYPSNEFP